MNNMLSKIALCSLAVPALALAVLAQSAPIPDYYPAGWTRVSSQPIITASGPDQGLHVTDPCVLIENGTYRMWYTGYPVQNIYYAESIDRGLTWTKFGAVLTPTEAWEISQLHYPTVIKDNGVYKMWYSAGGNYEALGYATSSDGITWNSANKVQVGTNIAWPMVVSIPGGYRMYAIPLPAPSPVGICCYESVDGGLTHPWTVVNGGNAVFTLDGGTWEGSQWGGRVFVNYDAARQLYEMFYSATYHIGYATSEDGLTWQRYSQNPVFSPEPANSWESLWVKEPWVVFDCAATEYCLFYDGYRSDKSSIGLARTRVLLIVDVEVHPRTLKLSSNGNWVTCFISTMGTIAAIDIDPSSPAISEVNGVPVTPVAAAMSNFQDLDGDGVNETLMVKFNRTSVAALLQVGENSLTITGRLNNGTEITGSDTIRAR